MQANSNNTIHRHSIVVRICHWVNAIAFVFLLVSGIHIFMGFPELHLGNVGYPGASAFYRLPDFRPPWDEWEILGDPSWGRNYHLSFIWVFFLNGLVYLIWGVKNKHFRRKMLPHRKDLTVKQVSASLRKNIAFGRSKRRELSEYNLVQKILYSSVIFILVPLMFATGIAQMAACNAIFPWLIDLLGGRQTARTLHTFISLLLVSFLLVHLIQVISRGFLMKLRSMTTGSISKEKNIKIRDPQ